MTKTYTQEYALEQIKPWFESHVSELIVHDEIEILRFAKPGTNCYGMEFIIRKGMLFISGDLGAAAHQWNGRLTWSFLVGCGFSYWSEKRQASEYGRAYDRFEAEALEDDLRDHILDEGEPSERSLWDDTRAKELDLSWATEEEWKWHNWVFEHWGDVTGGGDYCDAPTGREPDFRAYAHWLGLRLAVERLP